MVGALYKQERKPVGEEKNSLLIYWKNAPVAAFGAVDARSRGRGGGGTRGLTAGGSLDRAHVVCR